jgi:hypothetical protein
MDVVFDTYAAHLPKIRYEVECIHRNVIMAITTTVRERTGRKSPKNFLERCRCRCYVVLEPNRLEPWKKPDEDTVS